MAKLLRRVRSGRKTLTTGRFFNLSRASESSYDSEVVRELSAFGGLSRKSVSSAKANNNNEDRIAIARAGDGSIIEASVIDGYLAVIDGHGGDACAHFIREVLLLRLVEAFTDEESWLQGEDILDRIFVKLDEEYFTYAELELHKNKMEAKDTSGACVTTVVVKDDEILVANVGDCKGIHLSNRTNELRPLTFDHRASNVKEIERIQRLGGVIENGRVLARDVDTQDIVALEPTRTIGDEQAKLYAGNVDGELVVTPKPYVVRRKVEPKDVIIVATDGLWDVMNNKAAMKLCRKLLRVHKGDTEKVARDLSAHALKLRSGDDISVVVVVI